MTSFNQTFFKFVQYYHIIPTKTMIAKNYFDCLFVNSLIQIDIG